MTPRSFVFAGALILPALVLASCDNSNDSPLGPSTPETSDPPSIFQPDTRTMPYLSGKGPLSLAAKALTQSMSATTTTVGPRAMHDPTVPGMRVSCFDGPAAGIEHGTSDPFRTNHGCEHNTFDGDADPNNNAAFTLTTQDRLAGRLVSRTQGLQFYFAGGPPQGGSPRFSIFIDECTPVNGPTAQHPACPAGFATDGVWDETLFIDVNFCNDGDPYVGAVVPKSPNQQPTDDTCTIFEAFGGGVYPNFAAYVAANPGVRYARWFDEPNGTPIQSFIISDQPQHYLIYRVVMRASVGS